MKNITQKGFILLCLLSQVSRNAFSAGTTTADFLKVSPDSRSAALGATGAADPASGFAAFLNPALPAVAGHKLQVSAGQTQWVLGTQVSHYAATFRSADRSAGAWGAAVTFTQLSVPSFQGTDAYGNATGDIAFGARSLGVSLSRAWGERLALGAGVKQVTQGFEGGLSEQTQVLAWDAGIFARSATGRWNAGAVLANAGGSAGEGAAADRLPTTVRASLELHPEDRRFTWTLEGSNGAGKTAVGAGVGFSPKAGMTLRAGYDGRVSGGQYAGLTSGLGMAFGDFTLDYAFSPFGELGNVQRISASWAYGGARQAASTRVRRAARNGELKKWSVR